MDVVSFARDFLKREHSPLQVEFLVKLFGMDPKIFWPDLPSVLALAWGMGGGKNMTMETAVCYADYLLRCMVSPQMYFWGKPERRFIDIVNFSFVNEEQAREIFFDSMKQVLRECRNPENGNRWFEEQGVDLRDRGIGDIKEKIILLPQGIRNRCIVATKQGFEGSNILMGIFDEPSRTVTSAPANRDAHMLFEKVQSNTATRFGSLGKAVAFSYPEAKDGDLIMELVEKHAAGDASVWASRHATYEVNPLRSYDDPRFEEMRKKTPELYATIIECNPPASATGFYRAHPEKISESFRPTLKPVVEWERYKAEREVPGPDGQTVKKTYTAIRLLRCTDDKEVRCLGGDAGEVGDSFALAMGRTTKTDKALELVIEAEETKTFREPVTRLPVLGVGVGPDGKPERVPYTETRTVEQRLEKKTVNRLPIIDLLIELKPIVEYVKGQQPVVYPIDFISVKDFLIELKLHFTNLRRAKFEKWQTISLVGELVRAGINAETVPFPNSKQWALYSQHRQLVYNDYIWHTPCPAAERQFKELQDLNGKVDHKPDGGKDISDSIVLCTDALLETAGKPTSRYFF